MDHLKEAKTIIETLREGAEVDEQAILDQLAQEVKLLDRGKSKKEDYQATARRLLKISRPEPQESSDPLNNPLDDPLDDALDEETGTQPS